MSERGARRKHPPLSSAVGRGAKTGARQEKSTNSVSMTSGHYEQNPNPTTRLMRGRLELGVYDASQKRLGAP
jgi:hypothetical protein